MKKATVKIRVGREPMVYETHISAFLTPVAGLVIHPEVEYDTEDKRFVRRRNSWAITQYPTGMMAFGGIPTMEEALRIVTEEMAPHNWVGFTPDEAMAVNDAKELQLLARKVNDHIAASRKAFKGAKK